MSKGKDQDLKDLKQALTLTLTALLNPPATSPPETRIPTPTLSSDFLSLLELIKSSTTQLSLSLGKQPPTPHAALPSLSKLATDFTRLTYLLVCLPSSASLLRKEWGWCVEEMKEGLVALVRGFEGDVFGGEARKAKKGWEKEYLGRVGVVFAVVERATRTKKGEGLSKSEREAIGKKWEGEGEGLRDGEREAKEIIEEEDAASEGEDGDSEGDDEDEDEDDDGWEGLMGGKPSKKTPEEKEIVKKLTHLLHLPTVLHSHLATHHLPSPQTFLTHLHALLPLSATLLAAQDDLVASLYSSPFPSRVDLGDSVDELVAAMMALKGAVEEDLKVREGKEEKEEGVEKRRKWLDAWEGMVKRVEKGVREMLEKDEDEVVVAKLEGLKM